MAKDTEASIKKSASKSTNHIHNNNRLLVWSIILVMLLIIIAVSITYAFFSRNVTQTGDDTETKITAGKLDVDFVTTQYITNTDAKLINDTDAYSLADRTAFSVTRSAENTVEKVYYTLKLTDIDITENLKSEYLKWQLYDTDVVSASTKPLSSGDFTTITDNTLDLYTSKISLAKEVTHNFVLLVWLSNDENKNQTELLKGSLNAKVEVTAVNVSD